jgi:hypothetical protein
LNCSPSLANNALHSSSSFFIHHITLCRCAVWVATAYTRVVFVSKGIDYESQCNGEQCKSLHRRKGTRVCMGGVGSIKTLCVIRPAQCLVTSPTNTQRNVHPPAHGQARLRGRKCNASGFPGSGASAVIFPQPSWLSQGSAMNYVTLALEFALRYTLSLCILWFCARVHLRVV